MPSVSIKLPLHVVAKPKADGTFRVLFEVPKKRRPSGWLPTIPTPPFPHRTGKLDAAEIAAIKIHVEGPGGLLEQLAACRAGEAPVIYPDGSLPAAAIIWRASDAWAAMRPRTHHYYESQMRSIMAWSASNGHPHVSKLKRASIKAFLALYDDRQTARAAIRTTLRSLLDVALDEEWIDAHPMDRIKLRRTQAKRAVVLWTHADVETYATAAEAIGWRAGGRMYRLMWQTSADATDVAVWRRDKHFVDGTPAMICYDRGKTGVPAECAIGAALAADIKGSGELFLISGRNGRPYGADSAEDDRRRGSDHRAVRKAVTDAGGPALLMDHLRHSAVTDAMERGASKEDTAALSTHVDEKMNDKVYRQKTRAQIVRVQRARGIIE